jgi:Tol biopolymer transport system component
MVTDDGGRKMKRLFLLAAVLLLVPAFCFGFGKNKVQYRGFEWSILKSEYFDIYYYDDEEFLAERIALLADASCDTLSRYFSHNLSTRIPLMIYRSQNEFQQTNITLELLGEGVGGFTELYKNRVVLPFTGSYEELRHVTMHELTHVYNFDMLFGGLLQSVFARQYTYSLPLWFLEGLAEYASEHWDAEAEMVMRDAMINGYYFNLYQDVQGYLAYKQGQSVIRYIAERYGREKLSDILQSITVSRSMDKALVTSIGVDTQGLSQAWVEHVKKMYWPDIATRSDPEDIAFRLTNHREDDSFANTMPAISPDGQRIVFLSDASGYDDVYLMSALDGRIIRKLVKGQRTQDFESFHTLRSSFGWSPDDDRIVLVSKSKNVDRVYILDAETGKTLDRIEPDFDQVYRPAFSPDGGSISFIGTDGGRAGLYLMDLETRRVEALHTGALEYLGYSWSPDGEHLALAATGPGCVDSLRYFTKVDPLDKCQRDIYMLRVADGMVSPITRCPSEDTSPVWSPDGKKMIFISDRNGSYNLYVHDFGDSTTAQLTDVLGGIFSPSWSSEGDRLAISIFNEGGWDVYQIKAPLENLEVMKVAREDRWEYEAPWIPESWSSEDVTALAEIGPPEPDTVAYATIEDYERQPYRLKFSPDWVAGSFSYNSADGLGGLTRVSLSDILGNHRIFIGADFFSSFEDIDFVANYWYLARRMDYGGGVFHFKNYYYSDRTTMGTPLAKGGEDKLFSERNFGGVLAISFPLDKFRRFDVDFTAMRIAREIYRDDATWVDGEPLVERREDEDIYLPRISYTKDTTIWGSTGPIGGTRYMLSAERSIVDVFGSDLSFTTGMLDFRKYFMFSRGTQLATRVFGATSQGSDPAWFYIGGAYNLRGYEDFEFDGNNVVFASLELRYPFIDRLIMRGPIPLQLGGLRGALFFDIGGAWSGDVEDLRVAHRVEGQEELKDLNAGYGFGVRMWFSYFLMKLDFAWATRFNGQVGRRVHFSLGGEF